MALTEILMALMSFLLVVIGYFLRLQITVTKELTGSVNSLTKTVAVLENKNENFTTTCGLKHTVIDTRLNAHSKRLDAHEKDIAILQTKINV